MARRREALSLYALVRHVDPPLWRRLHVPPDLGLDELHLVLQGAFGWLGMHLHEFTAGGRTYADPEADPDAPADAVDEHEVQVSQVLRRKGDRLLYAYDFGDGWQVEVRSEGRVEVGPKDRLPACVDGARANPPEDCGGPEGYAELVAAYEAGEAADLDAGDEDVDPLARFVAEAFDPRLATADIRTALTWGEDLEGAQVDLVPFGLVDDDAEPANDDDALE